MKYQEYPKVQYDDVPAETGRFFPRQISPGLFAGAQLISVGTGSGVNISAKDGLFVGGSTFAASPFRVSLAGAVTASSLTVSGGTITGATISGNTISGNTISGGTISGTTVSGTTVTGGTISGTTISGVTVTGSTITGGTIRTAASGQRIVLNGADNTIDIYDGSGLVGQILGSTGTMFFDPVTDSFFDGDVDINNTLDVGGDVTLVSDLVVGGDLTVIGSKAFDMEHPTKPGYRLKYVALECPQPIVMCRGTADSEDAIVYPDHFVDVSEPGTIQCLMGSLRGTSDIAWVATAVRKGYADFVTEYIPEKSSAIERIVQGDTIKALPEVALVESLEK